MEAIATKPRTTISKNKYITPIIKVAFSAPFKTYYDYLPPISLTAQPALQIGYRVKVPFGNRNLVGYVVEIVNSTNIARHKLKNIAEIIDQEPLFPPPLFNLLVWISKYYKHPLGSVIATALPKLLRSGKNLSIAATVNAKFDEPAKNKLPNIELNYDQQQAISAVTAKLHNFAAFLLHGVTGSGKTEVYLQLVQRVIMNKQQVIILIPEIGLTPQTLARFAARFSVPIAVLHSRLTIKQRATVWLQAKHGHTPIILGTRSAAFVPLKNPGLFIIDEEHDPSFKQQSGLRYSARDLLIRRAQLENCPVVLGSATPALESLQNAQQGKYTFLHLPMRAGSAELPNMQVLDIRHKKLTQGLSAQLIAAIKENIAAKGQTLIFLNRRGYAPVLICHACGWTKNCRHCDAKMVLHYHPQQLICHHCQAKAAIPKFCPTCSNAELTPLGIGTERLEQLLQEYFPQATIARIDKDVTQKKHSMTKVIEQIHSGNVDIILGTQMLAKGHHFANITLVAILDIDSALFSADFRAIERMGQLITQVAGRAGREQRTGQVIIQTHHPQHPLLTLLLNAGYSKFSTALLDERKAARLPPFNRQILLRAQAKSLTKALNLLTTLKTWLKKHHSVEVLGPVPAPMEKKLGIYHAQLLLQSSVRSVLHSAADQVVAMLDSLPRAKDVRCLIDVDPIDLY